MTNKEKLREALEFAQDNNLQMIEVDGVKIHVPPKELSAEEMAVKSEQEEKLLKLAYNQEPQLTDEEILYYATPYFDELQEIKKQKLEAQKTDADLRE